MSTLLTFVRAVDWLNERVGRVALWTVGAVTIISAGNALARYALGVSSNAWLEIQWYLFGGIFLLGAGYTLKHNGHVRIDIFYGARSPRTRAWIDLVGSFVFLLPLSLLMAWLSLPGFTESWRLAETSPDAGGLLRWPVRLLIPLGFALLALQAAAEGIKRVAVLRGAWTLPEESPRVEE